MPDRVPSVEEDIYCPVCGYNLRGLAADNLCPECGRSSQLDVLYRQEVKLRRYFLRCFCASIVSGTIVAVGMIWRSWNNFGYTVGIDDGFVDASMLLTIAGVAALIQLCRLSRNTTLQRMLSRRQITLMIVGATLSLIPILWFVAFLSTFILWGVNWYE